MKWMACFLLAGSAMAGDFIWNNRGEHLELLEQGRTVFVYHHGEGRGCCYLHPLVSPKGVVVTDDGPCDHPHHRGLFWAWPIIEVDGQRYDLWMGKGVAIRPVRYSAANKEEQAVLRADEEWVVGGKVIGRDTVVITVNPVCDGAQTFTVQLTLEAVGQPVSIAGAPEQGKGYGGVSVRFAPRERTRIRTAQGILKGDEDHGNHEWAEFEGLFVAGRAGVRITADSDNPPAPKAWCLRQYGFLGANFPGVERLRLEPGKPLTLRYEVRVYDAAAE